MTINQLLLAIAAGLISAVVFASATTGAMVLRFVLFFLTPISLYLAGLGIGPAAAAVAAITATLTILALTNPVAALVYAVSAAMPAVITTRLALLGRDDGAAGFEWYPVGRIVAAAAIFGGMFAGLALILMGGSTDDLAKAMRTLVENFTKTELPQIPGSQPLTDAQIDEISKRALGLLPWTLAALSMITTLLNLWLAGRITLASGLLVRPWPDLNRMRLPGGATFALLAAMALAFLNNALGLAASGFAGAFTMAFTLVGLALVHFFTRGSPWRNFALSAIYAGLLLYTPLFALVLALAGLAETIFYYRDAPGLDRPDRDGPQPPPA